MPYFLLVALATMAVPWPRLRAGLQVMLMLWVTASGAQFLLSPARMLQWQQLVDGMVAEGPLEIRVAEPWVRDPILYFVERNGTPGVTVTLNPDPSRSPPNGRFWYVFRDTTWGHPKSPARMLRDAGFEIESMLAISAPNQQVIALRIKRASRAPML